MYVGSLAGVWKSTNQGRTWAPANGGMKATYIRAVAVDPSDPRIAYAGADYAGVFKSTNRGESWSPQAAATDDRRYYRLDAVPASRKPPPGLMDETAFPEP